MNIRESIEKSVLESLEELQIEDVFSIKVLSMFVILDSLIMMNLQKFLSSLMFPGQE